MGEREGGHGPEAGGLRARARTMVWSGRFTRESVECPWSVRGVGRVMDRNAETDDSFERDPGSRAVSQHGRWRWRRCVLRCCQR